MLYSKHVQIPVQEAVLNGDLVLPDEARGLVLFVHGSGSSRFSERNRFVAEKLQQNHLATLLFDLLTDEEEDIDLSTTQYRFDIDLLTERLVSVTDWVINEPVADQLDIGYFGASTGAAAALRAAVEREQAIRAVVSRGGRPDLAERMLDRVRAPTLLIVGGDDTDVIKLNRRAQEHIRAACQLEVIPGATHLFPEPGALDKVADLAAHWFMEYFGSSTGKKV